MTSATESQAITKLLHDSSVILHGHFRFGRKGSIDERHGTMYVNPRAIFRNWQTSWQLVQALFEKIPAEIRDKIQVVAGPVTGGVVLARDLSGLTSTNRDLKLPGVETVFLSPSEGGYEITPSDQKILEEKNVLLVDDVLHRGRTMVICASRIMEAGGAVIATAEIVDRGLQTLPIRGNPENFFVEKLGPDTLYKVSECPMCKAGEPITRF
jgi:orotate phosphoribosyltransferase